ncbi:MAG: HEAT repeat domain-containing protein [Planctomycetes bacterium]|nr:HEAT repeat domain-containing protein [Planctomycetota bacterium]
MVAPLRSLAPGGLLVAVLLAGCASNAFEELPPEQRDWLTYAREAELDGSWEVAAYALDNFARYHPGDLDEAYFERRATLADRAGRPEDCALARARLLRMRPADEDLRILLAGDLQSIGRGDEAVELLETEIHRTRSPLLREALAQVMGREGRPLEAARLYHQLAEEHQDPQRAALLQTASAFYEKGGDVERALETIELALGPERLSDEERRAIARMQAMETGVPQNVQDAVDLLDHHPEAAHRLNGALYLAQDRFPGDQRVFTRASADDDPRIRRLAVGQLLARAGAGALAVFEATLDDEDEGVRLASLAALGAVGGLEQVPALIGALDPEDRAAFRAARRALEQITGQLFGVAFDPKLEQRQQIAAQWQEWWAGRAVPAVGGRSGPPPDGPGGGA